MKERLELGLHPPSLINRLLERFGIREVSPRDICPAKHLDRLYELFPDLLGDPDIGVGNFGNCQSWRNYPEWWEKLVAEKS